MQLNTVNIVANEASVLTSFVSGYAAGAGVDDNLPSPVVAGIQPITAFVVIGLLTAFDD